MATLTWCKAQKKGIRLIDPNEELAKEYLQTAEETLEVLQAIRGTSKVWLATTKYYCEYFAVYSLLMKLGIKCEIHDCTIATCRFLEKRGTLPAGHSSRLEEDKQLRIDNQYYLKNKEVQIDYDEILAFIMTIKRINSRLTQKEKEEIRRSVGGRR